MRTLISYSTSLVTHAAVLGWLAWSFDSDPIAWDLNEGRASIQLMASMDLKKAPTEPEEVTEVDVVEIELPEEEVEEPSPAAQHDRKAPPPSQSKKPEVEEPPPSGMPVPQKLRRADRVEVVKVTHTTTEVHREELEPEVEVAAIDSRASPQSMAVEGTDVDEPPRSSHLNPLPQYPAREMAAGIQGVVTLLVHVTAEGTVAAVQVERTSGYSALDASAVATVWRWRFTPARHNGVVVAREVLVPVRFILR